MSKFRFLQNIFLLIMLLSISGCGNSPNVQISEISRDTISYDETIHINNCGGKADSEQTASRSFATTIEGGAEISAGYQSIVEGSLSAKYSEYRNISKSQKLIAPPNTNMEFVLRWSEDTHAGNITINGETGNYVVKVPVAVEQVSSQDLGGCSNVPVSITTQPQVVPTSIPIQPTTPPIVPQCPSTISRQTIEQWAQAGEVSKSQAGTYINDFDRMRQGGEYAIGTVLPAGVAIVTDFGNGESNIYQTLPVRAIAHYHSWGVFEVTSSYQAIQTGSCMTIVP